MRRLGKIKVDWSENFAYAIGLIATDGNLSSDKRHIHFTSKDEELVLLFKKCFDLTNKIGKKARGGSTEKKYFVIQFGDVNFYEFLLSLGLTPAKSKTLAAIKIPRRYFADFLRGCIDGDGNVDVYRHPQSSHLQLRLRLCSASKEFLFWLKKEIEINFKIKTGWISKLSQKNVYELVFGKTDSILIFKRIYYQGVESFLKRKYSIAKSFMGE